LRSIEREIFSVHTPHGNGIHGRSATGADGGARDFFEGYARDFDHIYEEGGKGPLARYVDTSLRKEMRIRFEKTFESLAPMQGRSLFDAGCGGGRYAIPAAKAGASQVLGIDFSQTMLDLARQKATAEGVRQRLPLRARRSAHLSSAEKSFDYAIAIGFFDYQKDPEAALRALCRVAKRRVFVSIPKRWHLLTPQRYVRYTFFRCYIRFYSRPEVEQLAAAMKPKKTTIFDIGREYNLLLDFE
jgi:ubiquinone/menaquinone biosynthesis C-methylase UbiE